MGRAVTETEGLQLLKGEMPCFCLWFKFKFTASHMMQQVVA